MPSFLLMIIVVIMRQNIVNGNVGMIVDVNVNMIMDTIMDTIMNTIVETRLIASLRGGTGITCDAGITYGTVKYTDLEIGKTSLNSMINN